MNPTSRYNAKTRGLTRRELLIRSLWVGGTLLIGPMVASAEKNALPDQPLQVFGPFIRINPDNTLTVVSKHSELGQGAQTGLAAIVAEEIGADWSLVTLEMAPANAKDYGHSQLKIQITGGSSSISNSWEQLRNAGAVARHMFINAAAASWNCPVKEVVIESSQILHKKSGRSALLSDMAELASKQPIPSEPQLKPLKDFNLLGTRNISRLDAKAKSSGQQTYTIDVNKPGLLTAVVAHSPRFGSKVKSFDGSHALKIEGVQQVFEIPTGVAVVARDFHSAIKGRQALKIEWDDSQAETRSDTEILKEHKDIARGAINADWLPFGVKGQASEGSSDLTMEFSFPYLAHAAMEPMNCVASVNGNQVSMTYGAQSQTADQMNIAPIVGCETNEVAIETLHCGGSFGRRSVARADFQKECVHIAKQVGNGTPVKLVWTREDDMTAGEYRPMAFHDINISVDKSGYPTHWSHRLVSASLSYGTLFQSKIPTAEGTVIEGVEGSVYFNAIDNVEAAVSYPRNPIPVLWLRSVGHTHTAFVMEHAIDQLARKANIDPAYYRKKLYKKAGAKKHLAVLKRVVELSNWKRPLENGWARGIAVHESFGSVVANVAEVSMINGTPKVRKVYSVIDCGFALSPDQIEAQLMSGTIYGLTFALYGEIKINGGVVETQNFNNYRVLRMSETPEMVFDIIKSDNPPSGTGEPGTPVIGPAVANAVLALTGQATTRLPLIKS